MQWLTAILAFAVTMLIFAIIVSTLVEMLHRLLRYRSAGLRLMLESLFKNVISKRLADPDRVTPAKFAEYIMENRAISAREDQPARGWISQKLHDLVDASVMNDIPVEVFAQKLADNRIVAAADNLTKEIVDDIAQKYEAYGKEASTLFERRARVFSVLTAFVVAWGFYVHPYKLAVTYFKNPEIAKSVADQAGDVHADYRALVDKLDEAKADGSVSADDTKNLREAIAKLQEEVGNAQKETRKLADLGVPVGWPDHKDMQACAGVGLMADCTRNIMGSLWTQPSIGSVFWLLVGGLLVGLGAPFWAQAVSNLSASRDVTRKITDIVNPQSMSASPGTRGFSAGPGAKSTPFAAFDLASAAQGLKNTPAVPGTAPPPPPPPPVKP